MEDRRIPIVDKRVSSRRGETPASEDIASSTAPAEPVEVLPDGAPVIPDDVAGGTVAAEAETPTESGGSAEEEREDFLDDLRRLQADFDNYRKRMMREQASTAARARARFIEQLLPVLDAFEQARSHEDASGGTELIYKQLWSVLEAEGLEEIPAEGVPFDPHVHDAVDSREDPEVNETIARSVYRRGYKVGDQVLRPAMVVVARPPEDHAPEAAEG